MKLEMKSQSCSPYSILVNEMSLDLFHLRVRPSLMALTIEEMLPRTIIIVGVVRKDAIWSILRRLFEGDFTRLNNDLDLFERSQNCLNSKNSNRF